MQQALILFLIAFFVALVIAPIVLWVLRRVRAGQVILHYVDFHKKKSGTATMGGFVFILPLIIIAPFILNANTPMSFIVVIASLGYAVLGFLDDFIKVRGGKNLGLRAYQKIIGQGGIALLVSIFYYMTNPEGRIFVPFANTFIDIGLWIAPLIFIGLIAATNSVNLTDGIDGLAGSVTFIYLVFLSAIVLQFAQLNQVPEAQTFVQVGAVACGALLCFLLLNSNKASIFMGDTGSLYLGSLIALLSFFSFLGLFIIVLGVMFVVSSVSDILQVAYFKWTKRKTGEGKRIFLMAPFHHHLEKKGWAEGKIVALYSIVTILAGVVCVVSLL
jgi:phospho-N-acetylmuramoyl-pentapeptide-transferase